MPHTRYFIVAGHHDLDVLVRDDADMDGAFEAICNDTGETLRINGWMIESCEVADGLYGIPA